LPLVRRTEAASQGLAPELPVKADV
jgi:hypothetical protein